MSRSKYLTKSLTVGSSVVGVALVTFGLAGAAFAGGYGPPTPPNPAPGGFSQVVASQPISSTGGVITGTDGASQVSASVPAGDFPSGAQIVLSAPTNLSTTVNGAEVGFSVSFLASSGQSLSGQSLASPVTVTIANPDITANSVLYIYSGGTFVPFNGKYSVSAGKIVIWLTQDPTLVVAHASPSTGVVPTSVSTGKPLLGESVIAGGLGLAGVVSLGGAVIASRRRRLNSKLA